MAAEQGARTVLISAAIESEIAQLDDAEAAEYMEAMGLEEPGLDRLIREGYQLLRPDYFLHRRTKGSPRMDRQKRLKGTTGSGCHSY